MVEYRCPICGKPVLPNFKFCKSCGARMPNELFEKKEPSHSQSIREIHSSSIINEDIVGSSVEAEPIDSEIVYALAIKGRLLLIDKEMEEILEEIENLEERVKVGLIPKEDAKGRVNELNKRFVEIKLEKKKVSKGSMNIPIFDLMDTRDQNKERLSKLEGLKRDKSISPKTYDKMKQEYEDSITDSEKQISQELIKMEKWKDQLKKDLADKRELLETLFVRKSTGEISESEYNEQRTDLSEEIKNWEAALEELTKTLKKLT
ncbi:MAG: zinc ribbon domain-containing protein [Candidatus Thorarchaeota archaeon]